MYRAHRAANNLFIAVCMYRAIKGCTYAYGIRMRGGGGGRGQRLKRPVALHRSCSTTPSKKAPQTAEKEIGP
jgi:hypothetical protein